MYDKLLKAPTSINEIELFAKSLQRIKLKQQLDGVYIDTMDERLEKAPALRTEMLSFSNDLLLKSSIHMRYSRANLTILVAEAYFGQ